MSLSDTYGRHFSYLRLSVTDVCNYRCDYCLPEGYKTCGKTAPLSIPEIKRAVAAFAELGVHKIRLTGGEPTLRSDFNAIAGAISQQSHIKKVALTTNGYRINEKISAWHQAGISALNISIDSLNVHKFAAITGHDRLHSILCGLDRALQLGFEHVKVNAVWLKGVNDGELEDYLNFVRNRPITVRFIELMETGDHPDYFNKHHSDTQRIIDHLTANGWTRKIRTRDAGPAQEFTHPDYQGAIGIIAPYSKDFCKSCNRLRLSSQGDLHLCLFGNFGIPLRSLLQHDDQKDELKARIIKAVSLKRKSHYLHDNDTGATRNLSAIGG